MNLLRFGSCGGEVQRLQELLNKHLDPRPRLRVDGVFGPRTEDAVLRYQATVGIGIDGVIGPRTWAALERGATADFVAGQHFPPSPQDAPWMTVAKKEIGQKELERSAHNPRILQYHSATSLRATADEVAWCSAFVNWCLKEVGIAGTNSAAAMSWLHWGQATVPRMGAISVLQRSTGEHHVGFLVAETREYFRLLGGNQSHQVKSSDFKKSAYVALGHRWPL